MEKDFDLRIRFENELYSTCRQIFVKIKFFKIDDVFFLYVAYEDFCDLSEKLYIIKIVENLLLLFCNLS